MVFTATAQYLTGPQVGQTFTIQVDSCGYTLADAVSDPFFLWAIGSTWTSDDSGDKWQIIALN